MIQKSRGIVFAFLMFPLSFPEESGETQAKWKNLCIDFPKAEFSEVLPPRSRFHYVTQKKSGLLKGWARAQFINTTGEELAERLTEFRAYPEWILPGINNKEPEGDRYFVSLDGLKVQNESKTRDNAIFTGPYTFEVLGFKAKGQTSVYVKPANHSELECLKDEKGDIKVKKHLFFRMAPRKDILSFLVGDLVVLERGTATKPIAEMWVRIVSELNPLIYGLLPEKKVHSELKPRSTRVFWNFLEYKSRRKKDLAKKE